LAFEGRVELLELLLEALVLRRSFRRQPLRLGGRLLLLLLGAGELRQVAEPVALPPLRDQDVAALELALAGLEEVARVDRLGQVVEAVEECGELELGHLGVLRVGARPPTGAGAAGTARASRLRATLAGARRC